MLDSFRKLYDIIKKLRSPGGCPWDREQSPMSIRGNLLEETLECIDAIEDSDDEHVKEELGDIYLLATMIGYMYEEKGSFHIADILNDINEKTDTPASPCVRRRTGQRFRGSTQKLGTT